jgi:pyridoxamine--pyruvate transaminase
MGLRAWPASRGIASACVTAVRVPDGLTDIEVRDRVREGYGVQLSAGQGAGNLIRLGHMGPTARPMLAVAGLAALGQGLRDLGADVDVGAGVAAAMERFSAPERTPVSVGR